MISVELSEYVFLAMTFSERSTCFPLKSQKTVLFNFLEFKVDVFNKNHGSK